MQFYDQILYSYLAQKATVFQKKWRFSTQTAFYPPCKEKFEKMFELFLDKIERLLYLFLRTNVLFAKKVPCVRRKVRFLGLFIWDTQPVKSNGGKQDADRLLSDF